jgi:hypothetical protein
MADFPVVATPAHVTPTDRSGLVHGRLANAAIIASGASYAVNNTITLAGGAVLKVEAVTAGAITAVSIQNVGDIAFGSIPTNPVSQVSTSGSGTGAQFELTWTGLATQMVASNASRKSLEVINPGTQVLWVSPVGVAAPGAPGSLPVYPGGSWSPPLPYTSAISVYGAAAGQPATIFEG